MNEKFWGVLLFVTALCWLNIHIHTFRNTQWAILQYDRCETNVIFFGRFSCYTEKCSRITTIGNNNNKKTQNPLAGYLVPVDGALVLSLSKLVYLSKMSTSRLRTMNWNVIIGLVLWCWDLMVCARDNQTTLNNNNYRNMNYIFIYCDYYYYYYYDCCSIRLGIFWFHPPVDKNYQQINRNKYTGLYRWQDTLSLTTSHELCLIRGCRYNLLLHHCYIIVNNSVDLEAVNGKNILQETELRESH